MNAMLMQTKEKNKGTTQSSFFSKVQNKDLQEEEEEASEDGEDDESSDEEKVIPLSPLH